MSYFLDLKSDQALQSLLLYEQTQALSLHLVQRVLVLVQFLQPIVSGTPKFMIPGQQGNTQALELVRLQSSDIQQYGGTGLNSSALCH